MARSNCCKVSLVVHSRLLQPREIFRVGCWGATRKTTMSALTFKKTSLQVCPLCFVFFFFFFSQRRTVAHNLYPSCVRALLNAAFGKVVSAAMTGKNISSSCKNRNNCTNMTPSAHRVRFALNRAMLPFPFPCWSCGNFANLAAPPKSEYQWAAQSELYSLYD